MIETKFKETEVGRVPADWEVKTLGEIGSLAMCKRIFQNETSLNGDVPFYKIGTFGQQADAYISKAKYEEYKSSYRFPKKGDILISAAGTIGRTVIYDGQPAYFQDSNIVWLAHNESKVTNAFLFYSYQMIRWNTEDTTIARLYNNNFNSTYIPLPPLPEQRRIATALSDIDSLISSLDELIEKKRNIKQGTMQQLLTGKTRLKGFSEPWGEKKLGEMVQVKRGVRVTRSNLSDIGNYPVYQNTNYPMGFYDKYNVNENNPFVIIGGSAGLLGYSKTKFWAADDCAYFGDSDEINKDFLYYCLCNRQQEILNCVKTGTVPRLDRSALELFQLKNPSSLSEQRAIASILTSMDDEIAALEHKREKYVSLKQGMMQELLTGRIRLV